MAYHSRSGDQVKLPRLSARLLVPWIALMLLSGLLAGSPAAAASVDCTNSSLQQVAETQKPQEPARNTMPVVFVHGIASGADTWNGSDSKGSFPRTVADLPKTSAWTFDYKPAQPGWVTDPRIGPALSDSINCLAQATGYKVMVVAHSMGGLVAQYAVSLPNDRAGGKTSQNVAEVVTIGTPTRGSKAASILHVGSVFAAPFLPTMEAVFGACAQYGASEDGSVCGIVDVLRGDQGTALRYDSPQIKALPPWPKELPVRAIAGDIEVSVDPLDLKPIPLGAIGDVAVTLPSATAYSNKTGNPYVCKDKQDLLRLVLVTQGSKCDHFTLKTQPTVVAMVVKQINRVQQQQTGLRTPELAYASGNTINLWVDGKTKALATIPSGYRAEQIAWSDSGLSVAWTTAKDDGSGRRAYLVRRGRGAPPVRARVRSWDCSCSTIAFRGEELVSDGASTPEQAALWSYPSSGKARKLAPVKALRPIDECFGPACGRLDLLGPGPNGTVSVAYIDAGGNFTGVGKLYRVDTQGRVERLGDADGSGRIGNETFSPTRDKIAIPWFGHYSACEEFSNLVVLDQRSGLVSKPDLPDLPGNVWLASSWFDSKGQVHAAFRSEPGCGSNDQFDSDGARVPNWGAAHVYKLVGGQWVKTNEAPVLAREVHRGGRAASLLGTLPDSATGGYSEGRLVAQNAANKTVDVAQRVHAFAWRPQTP